MVEAARARVAKRVVAEKSDAAGDSERERVSRARVAPRPGGEANGNKAVKLAAKDAGAGKGAVAGKAAADNSPAKIGRTPDRGCSSF